MHTRTHAVDSPYKCLLCQKSYLKVSALRIHSRTHTGERPYKCEIWHKAFADKCVLQRRSKTHREEKTYNVKLCETSFAQIEDLTVSVRGGDKRELKETFGIQKPYVSDCNLFCCKSFGCGICNEMFHIEKEFMEHCFQAWYYPIDDDFVELFED